MSASYRNLDMYDTSGNRLYTWFQCEEFEELWLTPEELEVVDPTGHGAVSIMTMVDGDPTPTPPVFASRSREDWLLQYKLRMTKITFSSAASDYLAYNADMESKYGPQGARFAKDKAQEMYRPFYTNARNPRNLLRFRKAVSYLRRRFAACARQNGLPPYDVVVHGTTGTSGALPTMLKKGSFLAETVGFMSIQSALFDLPGERNMRGKLRVINQDATANVRYIENEIIHLQNYLKRYFPEYFSTWLNPSHELQPRIYSALKSKWEFFSFDYDHCDEHMSWEVVRDVILPTLEPLLTRVQYLKLERFISQLFHQPIYWGDTVWVGLHNLLSGQIITNFLETVFGIILATTALLESHVSRKHYKIFCLGDDLGIALSNKAKDASDTIYQAVIHLSNEADMLMNPEKCSRSKRSFTFLRRVYWLGQPVELNEFGVEYVRGAYPSVLVLNQIINPEFYLSVENPVFFPALFSRLDNLYGSPEFVPFCEWILSQLQEVPREEDLSEAYLDWWYRLYGETWSATKSPSYKIATRMGLVK